MEYHLGGVTQTQVETEQGYTFAAGLRAILRQDPNVILVGEIRDSETAEIAINSAETGHLVFSTLHTNTAAGAFPRLIDLGIDAKIISSALNIAMAQRLVRKLCANCKKEISLEGRTKEVIEKITATIADKTYLEGMDMTHAFQNAGCEKCNMTGYKGRIGIYEAVLMDEAVEKIIRENPSEREIRRAALPQNILDMRQDGALKILQGVTTLEELERVVDIEKE